MQHYCVFINALLALVVCTTLTTVNCGPVAFPSYTDGLNNTVPSMNGSSDSSTDTLRMPRFTCDFFSAEFDGISVANGLCLAKCAAQRKIGGSCQNGLCVCSDKSF